MSKEVQSNVWEDHTSSISVQDVIDNYNTPKIHQKEFSDLVSKTINKYNYNIVAEIGCETGINCMLLNQKLKKYFLDLNPKAISLAKGACNKLGLKGNFLVGDMFNMPIENQSLDLIFNSGVIEHFEYDERINFLKEYKRVLKPNGRMVLAYPNHYSFIYRTTYLILKKLLGGFKWPWPSEYKFYDMKKEIEKSDLILEKREVIAQATIINGLKPIKPLYWIIKMINKIKAIDGYLIVLTIKHKPNTH